MELLAALAVELLFGYGLVRYLYSLTILPHREAVPVPSITVTLSLETNDHVGLV